MITGEDVKLHRGKEARRTYSERLGITEAKVAAIEKGRKIRPDEMEKLIAFGVPAADGDTSYDYDSAPASRPQSAPRPPKAPVAKKVPPPKIPKNNDAPIHLLGDDIPDWEDDAFWEIVTMMPEAPPPEPTYRELVPADARLVSNSEVQSFKRCKRKWWLAFYRGLRPAKVSPNGPLPIGTRAHAALAEWYVPDGQPQTDPRDALERILLDDWEKIEKTTDDELVLQSYAEQFKKDADLLRAMLEGYMQWLEETGADEDIEVVAPEAPMAAPFAVGETPVYITGRMDVRLRRRSDNARLFMDHKTVADMTKPTRVLHMNPQMKHYHLLEVLDMLRDRVLAGDGIHYEVERTDGAIYNMLRKVKRAVTAKPPFYQRIEVRHNKHEIANYAEELKGVIADMLVAETELANGTPHHIAVYPRPTNDCTWDCEFFAVCPMFDDGSRAEQFLEFNFKQIDPYDRYPEFTNGI